MLILPKLHSCLSVKDKHYARQRFVCYIRLFPISQNQYDSDISSTVLFKCHCSVFMQLLTTLYIFLSFRDQQSA